MFKLILLILQTTKFTYDSILKDSYRIDSEFFFSLNNPIIISILLTIIIFAVTIIFFKYIIVPMNKKHFDHEQSLKFEHSRLMALFTELDPNPVFRFDTEGKITMANKVGLEIFGSNFLYESKLSQIIPEMKESDLTSSISEGKKFNIDTKINDRYLQFTICGIPELKIGQIYGTDITERKQAEEALRVSEEKYRLIANNTADTIWTMDLNLKPTYLSPSISRIRGFTVEEAMLQTIDQVMTPESLQKTMKLFQEEIKLEESGTSDPNRVHVLELEHYRKDGSTVWVENSMSFLRDKNLKAVGILGTARDITERKRAEEETRQWRDRYERIVALTGEVVYEWDLLQNRTTWGGSLETVLGYSEKDLESEGFHWRSLVHPDEQQRIVTVVNEALQTLTSLMLEYRFRHKDGNYRHVLDQSFIVRDAAGKAVRSLGSLTDITEQRCAEEALRKKEERHKAVIESIFKFVPEGVLVLTESLNLLKQNKAFDDIVQKYASLLGYTEQELDEKIIEQLRSKVLSGDTTEIRIPKKKIV